MMNRHKYTDRQSDTADTDNRYLLQEKGMKIELR